MVTSNLRKDITLHGGWFICSPLYEHETIALDSDGYHYYRAEDDERKYEN